MREEFENRLKELYEEMNLTISFITFKSEINVYLRTKDESLNTKLSFYVWAIPAFKEWMEENNLSIDSVINMIVNYLKTTIIILRLPIREHNALVKANIKSLDSLKDFVKNPKNLCESTGLGLDLIESIILKLSRL